MVRKHNASKHSESHEMLIYSSSIKLTFPWQLCKCQAHCNVDDHEKKDISPHNNSCQAAQIKGYCTVAVQASTKSFLALVTDKNCFSFSICANIAPRNSSCKPSRENNSNYVRGASSSLTSITSLAEDPLQPPSLQHSQCLFIQQCFACTTSTAIRPFLQICNTVSDS